MPCTQKTSVDPHLGQNLFANLDFFALSDLPVDLVAIQKSTVSYGSSSSSGISSLEAWVS
jgi:hypothetical protein